MSSLRTESFGALAIAIIINTIVDTYRIEDEQCQYYVYIDNKEVIDRINNSEKKRMNFYYSPGYEILEEINAQIKHNYIKGSWHWIKGHTNDTTPAGLLNKHIDILANEFIISENAIPRDNAFPSNISTLRSGGQILHTHIYKHILQDNNKKKLKQYMQQKNSWTNQIYNSIDWIGHGSAMRNINISNRITIEKIIHEWNTTGQRNHTIEGRNQTCPICCIHPEDH